MKVTINGYEIEAPDDCVITVDGPRIKVERKAVHVEPIYVPMTTPTWPEYQRPWWQLPVTYYGNTYVADDKTQWSHTGVSQ